MVVEKESSAAARIVADDAVEDGHSSVGSVFQGGNDPLGIDGIAGEVDDVVHGNAGGTSAHWRQKGDLVAIPENVGRSGIFAIHGNCAGGPKLIVPGKGLAAALKQVGNGCARGEFEFAVFLIGQAGNQVAENAEEEESNAHASSRILMLRREPDRSGAICILLP
jgi:hypothetical protein